MDLFKALKKVGGITAPWGTMHIIPFSSAMPGQPCTYALTYARYDYVEEGGALRPRYFRSSDELESFLRADVHVENDEIKRAMDELQAGRTTSILDIYLSEDQIKRFGLNS